MKNIGLEKTGLDKLITSGYDLLNLNFYPRSKKTRAWTIKKNTVAQKAAGVIHSYFLRKILYVLKCFL